MCTSKLERSQRGCVYSRSKDKPLDGPILKLFKIFLSVLQQCCTHTRLEMQPRVVCTAQQ